MATVKKQRVRFDFFQVLQFDKNSDEDTICDISKFLQEINGVKPLENRVKSYFGEPVRMDSIHVEPDHEELTYFHLTRMRDEGIASTTEKTEKLTDLNLSTDDFIAEDANCIFDSKLRVLMLQRNIHSLSQSGLLEYLKLMYSDLHEGKDANISFEPVPDIESVKQALNATKYNQLAVKFASNNVNVLPNMLEKFLGVFKATFDSIGGDSLSLVISIDRGNKSGLKSAEMRSLINDVKNNKSIFSSVLVKGKQGDAPVEIYDLINGKYSVYHTFVASKKVGGDKQKRIHLNPVSVEEEMIRMYVTVDKCRSVVMHNLGITG
ncbi:hypothetical protein LBSP_21340 [Lentilactobacillus buchneri subsp. silagei]|uniref:DUF6731 family protein n=1 Tax=Lentilactobacillus buchneri TaxID=1581 RepID=UPI0012E43F7A|nr:DUF6731 family protein [Lentilactobacillus buchneri]GED95574.1 hypothetical protein LBSP_21340 [Lentilactobacillus buchneri subsp. silagei]